MTNLLTRFRQLPRSLLLLTGFSAFMALILLLDLVPFLRGGEMFNWQWSHVPVAIGRGVLAAGGVLLYLILAWWSVRRERDRSALLLAIIGATLLPLLVIALRYDNVLLELAYRTISPTATGPHTAAAFIEWQHDDWRNWTARMVDFRTLSAHVALSPPGLPLFYGALNQLFAVVPAIGETVQRALLPYQCHNYTLISYTPAEWGSIVFGVLMPLWAGLTVLPLYAIARDLIPHQARYLILLWGLIPSLMMYAPSWNTVYPLLSLIAFWLLLRGLRAIRGEPRWLAAGFVTGILTFANFSTVPLAGFFGFYTLIDARLRRDRPWYRPVWVGLIFGLGLLLPWIAFFLLSQQTPLDMLAVAFEKHLALERPFVPWLWMHAWEWTLLSGLPLILLWLRGMAPAIRQRRALPLALLLTLLVLLVSNTARGETGRVWLFFVPFALLAAGITLAHLADHHPKISRRDLWLSVWVSQAMLALALITTWDVMAAPDIRPRPDPPPLIPEVLPVNAAFDDQFTLIGWAGGFQDDEMILRFNWQAQQPILDDYTFSVIPVAPDGSTPLEAAVWQPDSTRYPTTCWLPGQTISDMISLTVPQSIPPGDWYISLRAFADVNNPENSLLITLPDGTQQRQIGLGPVIKAAD